MTDARCEPLLRAVLADDPADAQALRRLCLDALAERSRLAAGVLEDADSAAVHAAVRARAQLALAPRTAAPFAALRWLPRVAALLLFSLLCAHALDAPSGPHEGDTGAPRPPRPSEGAVAVPPSGGTAQTPWVVESPGRLVRVTTRAMASSQRRVVARFEAVASRARGRVRSAHRRAARIEHRHVARALPRGRIHGAAERIDDQRLLALFPGRARALVATPGGAQLLFLDEVRPARPGRQGPGHR